MRIYSNCNSIDDSQFWLVIIILGIISIISEGGQKITENIKFNLK